MINFVTGSKIKNIPDVVWAKQKLKVCTLLSLGIKGTNMCENSFNHLACESAVRKPQIKRL